MDMGRSAYRTKEENPVSILNRDFYHSDDPTNRGANQGEINRKRILIVEDHDLSVMLLSDFLEVHGYEILKTGHGLEAIKLARDNKPDLILMDIRLPDLSGLDVTRVLKQDDQTKYIPVIAVTAFAMSGDKAKALGSGMRCLYFKTCNPPQLAADGVLLIIFDLLYERTAIIMSRP